MFICCIFHKRNANSLYAKINSYFELQTQLKKYNLMNQPDQPQQGLYDAKFEHDACGIGFVASIKGSKSHQHIADALTVLENMEHRGACGC